MHKDSKKIVKKVLRSIINSATLTLAANEFARNHFETPVSKNSYERKLCDVAIQTRALNLTNRYLKSNLNYLKYRTIDLVALSYIS